MNLEEVKNQFPESASEIKALESLGFASRNDDWIDNLDLEKAQIASVDRKVNLKRANK
jgi:hypothetical protein